MLKTVKWNVSLEEIMQIWIEPAHTLFIILTEWGKVLMVFYAISLWTRSLPALLIVITLNSKTASENQHQGRQFILLKHWFLLIRCEDMPFYFVALQQMEY